ncbi:MAG: aminotransferase class IV [Anaerolineales bacterium]|nr:aminotransferase class IV [Anaerolineales bacterium]
MQNNTTQVWAILFDGQCREVTFPDQTSLDAITRQLPDGFYSTFRTYGEGTRVIGLKAHLRRLYDPVPAPDVEEDDLRRQLSLLLKDYVHEARARVVMTKQGRIYIMLEPLKLLPREVYEKGIRVETTDMARNTPRLKSTAFITASHDERINIAQKDIFEALLVKNGEILEGMTSNFFYVTRPSTAPGLDMPLRGYSTNGFSQRELCTAQRDILLGVTRRTVIRVARGMGLEVKYQPLKRDQLNVAREAFITSSSRGVVPVIQIDDVTVGQGSPGQITKQLSAAYEEYVLAKAEEI